MMEFETNVQDIIQRTYNVKSFRFPRPAGLSYKAGQYMFVTIKASGKELKRHFTISSSPSEQGFIEFTKRLTESEFSNALIALKPGDWAKISAPYGVFTLEGEFAKVGMLSGGIGITPLISMCRYCTDMKLDTKITLLYGNRSEQDIVFRKELEEMRERNRNLKVIFTLDEPGENWKGYKGRITVDMIKKEIPDYLETVFFTCGPPAMVEAMKRLVATLNIPQNQIKWELFSGY
jgi:ferredoxin-NADP reductase